MPSTSRTTRDMTEAEFRAALKRNGFRLIMGGWIDRPAKPGLSVGVRMVKRGGEWHIARRESITKAIKAFAKHDAEQDEKERRASLSTAILAGNDRPWLAMADA